MRLSGKDCIQTRPGPRSVAKNRPSPPNIADLILPTYSMSYEIVGWSATRHPVSMRSNSPGARVLSISIPPACTSPTVPLQSLHNEAFAAKESHADPLLERNPDTHTFGRH